MGRNDRSLWGLITAFCLRVNDLAQPGNAFKIYSSRDGYPVHHFLSDGRTLTMPTLAKGTNNFGAITFTVTTADTTITALILDTARLPLWNLDGRGWLLSGDMTDLGVVVAFV